MSTEPVAIRYDFDGYGYQYRDAGHGSNWMARLPEGELLYTHPAKELHLSLQKNKEIGELLAVTYTDDEHRIVEVLWQKPPAKTLTDEEIREVFDEVVGMNSACGWETDFARAILRKAQEK